MGDASQFLHWLSMVWEHVSRVAAAAWPSVCGLLNSSFTTALAGAALGAVAGAWAAQRIAKRDAGFEAALTDIRNANSATTFAVGVANALTGLKRQFVVTLVRDFSALVDRHNAYLSMVAEETTTEPFHFNPDMKFIKPQETPINELGDILRANAGDDPVAWLIFQTLRQVLANIDMMLLQRNEVLEEIRTAPPERSRDAVSLYLGRPRADGNTDGRHVEIMKELPRNVDDGLGFSRVLAEHISERARKVADPFGKKAPLVRPADFSRADALGVFPDMKGFRDEVARIRGEKVGATLSAAAVWQAEPKPPEGPAVS